MLRITANAHKTIHSSALIKEHLFTIDYGIEVYNPVDGSITYTDINGQAVTPLHLTSAGQDILWEGITYTKENISHSDMSFNADGSVSDITVTVGNLDRKIQNYIEWYKMGGKKVTITRLLFDSQGIYVDSRSIDLTIKTISAREDFATFTLSSGVDVLGISFPSVTIRSNICRWIFRGKRDCKYSGPDATCKMTWSACLAKGNSRNFGGFPGVINEKFYI